MAQIPFLGAETSVNDTPFLGSPADTLNLDPVELKIRKGIANGYAPLDGNAKVPVANLPDTTSLDAEVDAKITTHNSATTSVHGIANTANLVLTSDSRLSDSRAPTAHKSSHATGGTDALSASDIGAVATTDTRISNTRGGSIDTRAGAVTERTYETGDPENPTEYETSFAGGSGGNVLMRGGDGGFDMLGGGIGGNSGSINLSGFTGIGGDSHGGHGGSITLMGGWDSASAGSINLNGGSGGADNHGGSIISTGNGDYRGGTLNMSAGDGEGGSINTSNGGGSINTSGNGGGAGGHINLSSANNTQGTPSGNGGSIELTGGYGEETVGGNGGNIFLKGANVANGNGGSIISNGSNSGGNVPVGINGGTLNMSASRQGAGGSINTSAGTNGAGGSINLSNGGGSLIATIGAHFNSLTNVYGGNAGGSGTIDLSGGDATDASNPQAHWAYQVVMSSVTFDSGAIGTYARSANGETFVKTTNTSAFPKYFISQGTTMIGSATAPLFSLYRQNSLTSSTMLSYNTGTVSIGNPWKANANGTGQTNAVGVATSNGYGQNGGSGGSLLMAGGDGSTALSAPPFAGGSAGSINTSANNLGNNGGFINTSAGASGAGGLINTSNGGGLINTSNGGGFINTSNGGGSINLSNFGAGSIKSTGGGGEVIVSGGSIDLSSHPNPIFSDATGGSINLAAGDFGRAGNISSTGGYGDNGERGGDLNMSGNSKRGGDILTYGGAYDDSEGGYGLGAEGGDILTYGGQYNGGSINTSNGGGSINTRGTGSIGLGVAGTRTTINGSASGGNKTITLPNATGTIALRDSFTIAVPNVDIGKTVSSNPLGWTQQVTIPANIAELTGGLPCLLDSVGLLITNRLGTGQIHSSSTVTAGIRVGSQSVLTLTPVNGVGTYNADNYFSTLQTGTRPWTGNYSKAFSTGGTFGRSLYTGGDLFINSPIVSGTFRTEYWNTTLTEAMDATQTTLLQGLVSGGTSYEGTYLKIDDEVVLITSWPTASGFRPTILRAQLGTTATTHAIGASATANLGSALGGGILATVYLNFIRVA